jgi:hypothetical protein
MSRDVDQSAARANALKTLDDRRAASAMPPPLPPQQMPQPQRPAPAGPYPGPVYQQPGASGNALMHGMLGFMLGRAMSQTSQPVAYPTTNGNQNQPASAGTEAAGMVTGMPGLTAPQQPQQPSFFMRVLRWFAWLSVLSLLMWAAVYSVRKFRRLRPGPNYSFERN